MNLKEARSFLGVTVSKTRYSAREVRKLDFTIDTDYIMSLLVKQDGKCALTGWNLEFTRGGDWDGKNPKGATMDRINNSKGYVPGNIQLVCGLPNSVRGALSMKEFTQLCCDIADNSRQ